LLSIFTRHCCLAGDSHTAALTEKGAVYAWGTYRDATGVFGFAPGVRVGLLAILVWDPKKAAEQAVKVASGMDLSFAALLLACTINATPIVSGTIQGARGSALHILLVYLLQPMLC